MHASAPRPYARCQSLATAFVFFIGALGTQAGAQTLTQGQPPASTQSSGPADATAQVEPSAPVEPGIQLQASALAQALQHAQVFDRAQNPSAQAPSPAPAPPNQDTTYGKPTTEGRIWRASFIAAIAAHGADLSTTAWCRGQNLCEEANPVLKWADDNPITLGFAKMGFAAAVQLIPYWIMRSGHRQTAIWINVGQVILFSAIAAHNANLAVYPPTAVYPGK